MNEEERRFYEERGSAIEAGRAEAYAVVKDLKRVEGRDSVDCIDCHQAYRNTKARVDEYITFMVSDIASGGPGTTTTAKYAALDDSLRASLRYFIAKSDEYLRTHRLDDPKSTSLADAVELAVKALADLIPRLDAKDRKRLSRKIETYRWVTFEEVR